MYCAALHNLCTAIPIESLTHNNNNNNNNNNLARAKYSYLKESPNTNS
jgi:hypothetical protein